ncbi:DUF3149 domain-containing protein [Candidatus Accumulibacter phosphatis]|uniref:DUF3149 domain-containing protein n=1 Tax=Candidatus Accumulibacter phosphatis TaxID=327160 RepID=A0ABX1TVI0_9PROT|nr:MULTISPECIES: DUF3149 domain-containing protein [Candidatus Accumulibacter]NMQ27478.1 DUF3149 domain-containing protein [Candidatus Accumulibacter phosphatis]
MAWDLLFSSDYGLFSVFVIVFLLGMSVWFPYYFHKKMRQGEQRNKT